MQHLGTSKLGMESQQGLPVGSDAREPPSFCPAISCVFGSTHVIVRSLCSSSTCPKHVSDLLISIEGLPKLVGHDVL